MKESKYKDLRFESKEAFEAWLEETATRKIILDGNQDVNRFWIDDEGEILHCFYGQQTVWIGSFIKLDSLAIGKNLMMFNPKYHNDWTEMTFNVESIENLNPQP
jgi:hypothetical protein